MVFELQHDVVDCVVGQPDGGRVGLQPRLQAEVLPAVAQDGADVLDGEEGGVLQVPVGQVQPHQLSRVAALVAVDQPRRKESAYKFKKGFILHHLSWRSIEIPTITQKNTKKHKTKLK